MHSVKLLRQTIALASDERVQIVDLTKQVREIVVEAEIADGIVLVNSLHTTCALFVNEFQAALAADLRAMIERLVPDCAGYKHDDPRYSDCERGNASAHLRTALLGRSLVFGLSHGELALGRFQSILFAELDGPRRREVDVQILGT